MTRRTAALRVGLSLMVVAVLAALGFPGCGVTTPSPTPPPRPAGTGIVTGTSSAPIQRVEIFYIGGVDWLSVGSTFSYGLFGVHSDGVYEKLGSNNVTWRSSNPAVIEFLTNSFSTLRAVSPGTAVITATYQGLSDSITQEIRSGRPPFPYLDINPLFGPTEELRTQRVRAVWNESVSSFPDVTAQATWTTSNPLVATVNAGLITATGVGTVRITATYQGFSKSFMFSVSTSVPR